MSYLDLAEKLLSSVESQCDVIGDKQNCDVDIKRSGTMITLGFDDGSEMVINLQKPLEEVWLASRLGGYHFKWIDGQWRSIKDNVEFFARLSADFSHHVGVAVVFHAKGALFVK